MTTPTFDGTEQHPVIVLNQDTVRPLTEKVSTLAEKSFNRLAASAGLFWLYFAEIIVAIGFFGTLFGTFINNTYVETISQGAGYPKTGYPELDEYFDAYGLGQQTIVETAKPGAGFVIALILFAVCGLFLAAVHAVALSNLSDAFIRGQKPSVKELYSLKGRIGGAVLAIVMQFLFWLLFALVAAALLLLGALFYSLSTTVGIIVVAIFAFMIVIAALVFGYAFSLQTTFGALGYDGLNAFKASWKVTTKSFSNYGVATVVIIVLMALPIIGSLLGILIYWFRDTLVASVTGDARIPETLEAFEDAIETA